MDEPDLMGKAAEKLGYEPLMPKVEQGNRYQRYNFDGGDSVPFVYDGNRCLLIGVGGNTHITSVMKLAEELLPPGHCDEVIAVQMIAGRTNLDECFVPVTDDVVAAHVPSLMCGYRFVPNKPVSDPERFDFAQWIRDLGYTLTFDPKTGQTAQTFEDGADSLNTNYLCLGHSRKVVGYGLDPRMLEELAKLNVNVVTVEGSEMIKGNGGVRCLTRPLYM
jgi:arginine deiminase